MDDWTPICGFEGLYECTSDARFRSAMQKRGTRMHKPLSPTKKPNGYLQLALRKDGRYHTAYTHRLVAATFLGAQDLEINHKNGVKHDNRVENLEYTTTQLNLLHACRSLGKRRGENHWNARLKEDDVKEIHRLRRGGMLVREIAARFGLQRASVSGILTGKQWPHLFKA